MLTFWFKTLLLGREVVRPRPPGGGVDVGVVHCQSCLWVIIYNRGFWGGEVVRMYKQEWMTHLPYFL